MRRTRTVPHLDAPATEIADLSRRRWAIERFLEGNRVNSHPRQASFHTEVTEKAKPRSATENA